MKIFYRHNLATTKEAVILYTDGITSKWTKEGVGSDAWKEGRRKEFIKLRAIRMFKGDEAKAAEEWDSWTEEK